MVIIVNEENLITYYNKFNEDKRLNTRHGKVEFIITMKYINEYLEKNKVKKILDIGAGTGKYSIALANQGYDVTAVELIKHNLRVIEKNSDKVKTIWGNAINLKKIKDNTFDFTMLFGPMYHLCSKEEQIKALLEAKRVTKKNGIIMVAYIMNDYAIISRGFKEHEILNEIKKERIDNEFKVKAKATDLYNYVSISDINILNKEANLKRIKIFTPDGPANYLRTSLNEMDESEFKIFIDYVLSISERMDLIGACAHVVDILRKEGN
jgi:ubiquinone/menaquinone biosynthesis C-methylase UbiE